MGSFCVGCWRRGFRGLQVAPGLPREFRSTQPLCEEAATGGVQTLAPPPCRLSVGADRVVGLPAPRLLSCFVRLL